MKKIARLRLFGAVMAALPVLGMTAGALGQYRVDDSHVNDANNRIGSGGYNSSHDLSPRDLSVSGNQIVSGNVTGLDFFHGTSLGTDDPNYFGGASLSPTLDRFNAISGPVNYGARSTGASTAQPYFNGDTSTAAPPPNFTTQVGTGAYTPAAPPVNQPYDARLGYFGDPGAVNSPENQAFPVTPGELDLPGPADTSGNATTLTASPLYGIRDWQTGDSSSQYFLSRYSNTNLVSPSDRDRVSNASIQQMRNELNSTIVQGPNGQTPDNSAGGAAAANANPNNLALGAAIAPSSLTPTNGTTVANTYLNPQPLGGEQSTGQSMQQIWINLPSPDQQSSQIADLETRQKLMAQRQKLMANGKGKLTAVEATAQFNAQQQYIKDYNKAAGTGAPGTGKLAAPTDGMGPSTTQPTGVGSGLPKSVMTDHGPAPLPATPQAPPVAPLTPMVTEPLQHDADEQPYIVTSLATGIRAKGLADLMKSAENQMRDGHFNAALDSYDSAEQVAPNNPFIAMGRGFAEMGASYYGKAELDLRRAIAAEPALLAGRYDIKGFLGEDRLKFVVNDLTDIYQSEKDSVRPAVLLGFISHNEGDDTAAAKYLDAADQRAGGRDPIITVMREDWGFVTPK